MAQPQLRRRFWPGSTRLRILGWILIPISLVLLVSWFEVRSILQDQVNDRIELELLGEVAELRLLAEKKQVAAGTEGRVAPQDLVREYLERSIPDTNEVMFGVVDGRVDSRSIGTPPYRLDQNTEFVRSISQISDVVLGEIGTPAGLVQYIAVPVSDAKSNELVVLVVGIFADEEAARSSSALATLLIGAIGSLLLAGIIGWFVSGRLLAPIRQMRDTAIVITESDLTDRIPVSDRRSGDDLDELARTFNSMLDRIESAFDSQREFVDDAGHELRTPLTIIRGHLELLAYEKDPHERESIMILVADELSRMSRIVSDLQLLTKANSNHFIEVGPIDTGDFVVELLDKVKALGDRTWIIDSKVEGVVVADRQRITQAMIQLASNAAQYTQPGQEIGLGISCDETNCDLWVRDTGPGVPVEQRELIFERFHRTTRNNQQRSDGAGLGLAIVKAIAQAHGGKVAVEDSPGGGAVFRITIPAPDPKDVD
jgi:two-component system OmpR family sensor kinase